MKYLVLAGILLVIVTYYLRRNRGDAPTRRGTSMYDTDDGAINVRSADNVRLISDDQLDAIENDKRGAADA